MHDVERLSQQEINREDDSEIGEESKYTHPMNAKAVIYRNSWYHVINITSSELNALNILSPC
jgi:hypothetical protein